jgi:DNA-binding response OmpR family regulator
MKDEMTASDKSVVLIIEDEPDVVETYKLWLVGEYEVRTAEGGDEGLERLDDDVDVVLLDRMMPGLSGDEVLEQIRECDLDCRVAMVTAVEPDFDILEMGFDAYLSKPVESTELHDTVTRLLDRSAYDDLLQEYYALVEKRATLESIKSDAELAGNDRYQGLVGRIESLRTELDGILGGIEDDQDFIATLRELDDSQEQ